MKTVSMMATCKTLTNEDDIAARYSRRLSYAAIANKTQKHSIEKLKTELKTQTDINDQISTKLDRLGQLCNTRQILIKQLKDDMNKIKAENSELKEENKTLLDEVYNLRYSSRQKLTDTQEELYQMTVKHHDNQEELLKQVQCLKEQIDILKTELNNKDELISKFVMNSKQLLSAELTKLSKALEDGTYRIKIAENKSQQLCKAVIKLLSMFHQRRIARRVIGIESSPISTPQSNTKKKSSKKENSGKLKGGDELDKPPSKISTDQINIKSLQDVIEKLHTLIHKSNFSDELGTFLFNSIVNPFLYNK